MVLLCGLASLGVLAGLGAVSDSTRTALASAACQLLAKTKAVGRCAFDQHEQTLNRRPQPLPRPEGINRVESNVARNGLSLSGLIRTGDGAVVYCADGYCVATTEDERGNIFLGAYVDAQGNLVLPPSDSPRLGTVKDVRMPGPDQVVAVDNTGTVGAAKATADGVSPEHLRQVSRRACAFSQADCSVLDFSDAGIRDTYTNLHGRRPITAEALELGGRVFSLLRDSPDASRLAVAIELLGKTWLKEGALTISEVQGDLESLTPVLGPGLVAEMIQAYRDRPGPPHMAWGLSASTGVLARITGQRAIAARSEVLREVFGPLSKWPAPAVYTAEFTHAGMGGFLRENALFLGNNRGASIETHEVAHYYLEQVKVDRYAVEDRVDEFFATAVQAASFPEGIALSMAPVPRNHAYAIFYERIDVLAEGLPTGNALSPREKQQIAASLTEDAKRIAAAATAGHYVEEFDTTTGELRLAQH